MSPQRATIHPAPVYGRRSRTVTVNPVGAFRSAASCESERCVFAMQIGSLPSPLPRTPPPCPRGLEQEDAVGAVDARGDRPDLLLDRRVVRVREAEVVRLVRSGDDRLREGRRALACSKPVLISAAYAPLPIASLRTSSSSSAVSVGNLLTATTALSPKCFTIPMWRARLAAPPRSPPCRRRCSRRGA